jgi:hypothetical protein
MSSEQTTGSAENQARQTCVCREVLDNLNKLFEISPNVRQHLANSRIEFLKAIRAAIDQRIDNLSSKVQQGSHIPVE